MPGAVTRDGAVRCLEELLQKSSGRAAMGHALASEKEANGDDGQVETGDFSLLVQDSDIGRPMVLARTSHQLYVHVWHPHVNCTKSR